MNGMRQGGMRMPMGAMNGMQRSMGPPQQHRYMAVDANGQPVGMNSMNGGMHGGGMNGMSGMNSAMNSGMSGAMNGAMNGGISAMNGGMSGMNGYAMSNGYAMVGQAHPGMGGQGGYASACGRRRCLAGLLLCPYTPYTAMQSNDILVVKRSSSTGNSSRVLICPS